MKLTMLGTGHAGVTECYNTCFVISDGDKHFLVDGGGGNTVLRQIREAGIDLAGICDIFVTHRHMDHIMGIFWMLRRICSAVKRGGYPDGVRIYSHAEVIGIIDDMTRRLLPDESVCLGSQVQLIPVADGETREVIGHPVTFFDIHANKAPQFGFTMTLEGDDRLTCCGDEPYREPCRQYAEGSKWLLHEAFCMEAQAEKYNPHRISHSSVKDACEAAKSLGARNLLIYHTEDSDLANRRRLYTAEAEQYFDGGIYVPDDLERIEL